MDLNGADCELNELTRGSRPVYPTLTTNMEEQNGNNKEMASDAEKKGKVVMMESNDNFGPWMVVQRQRRGRKDGAGPSNTEKNKEGKGANKSRFSALEVEETEMGDNNNEKAEIGANEGTNAETTSKKKNT
ncbi:hypothetical protein PIB30_064680 [Stylosanthes scabra]|uniref:Uncharacterized protein n=1 Tax=Stylosanthes scabra TaxID=79078 RepID=A0ABU6UNI8_9FABA|nr:hypothetical protein [Stylosanthes scabra]